MNALDSCQFDRLDVAIAALDPEVSASASPKQQDAILAFSRRTGAAPDTRLLMEDAVALLIENLQADLGGVGEVAADGNTIALTIAGADQRSAPAKRAVYQYRLDAADSLAALALNRACPISIPYLPSAPRLIDRFLIAQGVVGALAVPLHLNARPYGVLGVYTRRKRRFEPGDVSFAETIAHLLTSSVARAVAETALCEQRAVHSTVLEMVDALVLTLDADGRVVDMNRHCHELTGYAIENIRSRPFWEVLAATEDCERVRAIFRDLPNGGAPGEFELPLRTKDGRQRRVSWSLEVLANGQAARVILTGRDQTEHLKTKEELEKVTALAQRAVEVLRELRGVAGPAGSHDRSEPSGGEKRSSPRREYHYSQLIAPFDLTNLPRPKEFFPVDCKDISAGGISFFLDGPPDFSNFVIALGRAPSLTHFTARVMRVAGCRQEGRDRYLVGCRFSGRIYL